MKAFGLELRRSNTLVGLYEEVDNTLAKFNVQKGGVSSTMARDTVAHALQKMIKGSHLSICTVDRISSVCGVIIPAERRNVYSSIHCMNWNEMTPEYRQEIVAMLLDDFRSVLMPEEITEIQIQEA